MSLPIPIVKDLVLVGGGHAHALVLRKWGMSPLAGVRLTLVNPTPSAPYTGMLPGFVAGHYDVPDVAMDMVRLARFADARFVAGWATGIDQDSKAVMLSNGRRLRYDALSLNIGINSETPDIIGFNQFGVAVKPMDVFARKWRAFLGEVEAAKRAPHVAVIGGGMGGVEMAMAMHHALAPHPDRRVTLIDIGTVLDRQSAGLRDALQRRLASQGIDVIEHAQVQSMDARGVALENGAFVVAELIVTATGARAHDWLARSELANKAGYVDVGQTLQSVHDPDIFACGDCANLVDTPRPKAGVFAVRAAPVLFDNLRAHLSSATLRPFNPQKDYLKLISCGDKTAIGEKWGLRLAGPWVWRQKDKIDRKFIDQFRDLPKMQVSPLPDRMADGTVRAMGAKPLCGGCGAKVSDQILSDVLSANRAVTRPDVLSGPGDDAAVLAHCGDHHQVMSTDHLRSLWNDPYLMAKILAVHALGDIWAMGAAPQAAMVNLTLPPMSLEIQQNTLSEIMDSIHEVLSAEGMDIVGGHTSVGAELAIGLTATGLAERPIGIDGAKPGDLLILTKPIGTGTIMAAEMALEARGTDVLACLQSMTQSSGEAARVLAKSANAMTDVTGFGLAGHLRRLAHASEVSIKLDLAAIPLLPGAADLANSGTRSSIFESNSNLLPHLLDEGSATSLLMFDPQTSGGLLAALPARAAPALVKDLQQGWIIGQVAEGAPNVTF